MEINQDIRDKDELFHRLYLKHVDDLRAYTRSLLPTWTDTEEVMQKVAIVIWRKFDDFDPSTSFIKWSCVIAKYEVLSYRRMMARDRLVFNEDFLEMMADEATEEAESTVDEQRVLDDCLQKLGSDQREMVIKAYGDKLKIHQVAKELGKPAGSLYVTLSRLKKKLFECMQSNLKLEGLV
jgi:RNA polymerase sigma-70 factor (ECF subfamily)